MQFPYQSISFPDIFLIDLNKLFDEHIAAIASKLVWNVFQVTSQFSMFFASKEFCSCRTILSVSW